ncbi:MAG: hypothetical protein AB7N24_15340 [Dehalococcoidia bacterium]
MSAERIDALDRTLLFCEDVVLLPGAATRRAVSDALGRQTVAIVSDAENLKHPSAQSAVVALTRLVLGYGASVRLVFPEVSLVSSQPPLEGHQLRRGILDLAAALIPGATAIIASEPAPSDLVFVVGDTNAALGHETCWRLQGTNWSGETTAPTIRGRPLDAPLPFGALIAAGIASAEAFKAAMRSLGTGALQLPEAMALTRAASFRLDVAEPEPQPDIHIGDLDCISAGAITNAMLFALLRVPGIRGRVRVIDDDIAELTNLNRYMLLTRSQLGVRKEVLLASFGSDEGLSMRFASALLGTDSLKVLQPFASQIFIGADRIPARWAAQAIWPTWLCVGATDEFLAMVTEHPDGRPCAACVFDQAVPNPPERIATLSFVSYWAGLIAAARLVRRATHCPYPPDEHAVSIFGPTAMDSPVAWRWSLVSRREDCRLRCAKRPSLGRGARTRRRVASKMRGSRQ